MKKKVIIFTSFLIVTTDVKAAEISDQQLIHQQERQKALEAQLAPPPADIRLSVPETAVPSKFPVDTPCFPITRVVLEGTEHFPHWLPLKRLAQQGENQCLGTQGINILTRILDKKLTRSLFQEQSFGVHQKQLRGGNRLWTT
ncbi:POTRA domain-containing protein [Photorhabdus laumondii]